jgi:predicted flap endonuclease-1-like 5' DNA nuclease
MRSVNSLSAAIALSLLLAGCGSTGMTPASAPASQTLAARAVAVEEGQLIFDKQIVYSTVDILGIGAVYHDKLAAQGVKTVNELLLSGGKRSDRDRLAKQTGISEKLLLTWINHGDLMRVTGAGPEYARLLELAGVDTTPELAKRVPANLVAALAKANDLGGGKVATHRLPNVATTTKWVENAKQFVKLVSY